MDRYEFSQNVVNNANGNNDDDNDNTDNNNSDVNTGNNTNNDSNEWKRPVLVEYVKISNVNIVLVSVCK